MERLTSGAVKEAAMRQGVKEERKRQEEERLQALRRAKEEKQRRTEEAELEFVCDALEKRRIRAEQTRQEQARMAKLGSLGSDIVLANAARMLQQSWRLHHERVEERRREADRQSRRKKAAADRESRQKRGWMDNM